MLQEIFPFGVALEPDVSHQQSRDNEVVWTWRNRHHCNHTGEKKESKTHPTTATMASLEILSVNRLSAIPAASQSMKTLHYERPGRHRATLKKVLHTSSQRGFDLLHCSIMQTKRKAEMKSRAIVAPIVAALCCTLLLSCGRDNKRLEGHWNLVPEKSASIDPWTSLALDIHTDGTRVTIVKRYSAGHPHDRRVDSITVNMQGREETVPVPPGRWLGEVSMGVYYGPNTTRRALATMNDAHNELRVDIRETLQTAQGAIEAEVKNTYALSPEGSSMQWSETRSTRESGPPLSYTFTRMTE